MLGQVRVRVGLMMGQVMGNGRPRDGKSRHNDRPQFRGNGRFNYRPGQEQGLV